MAKNHRGAGPALDLIGFGEIPLREASGLAIATLREGQYLVAVGDHGPTVALAGQEWAAPGANRLVCLAWWPAKALADLSDAEVGPDQALYLLSDQSNAVAQLCLPVAVGERLSYSAVWSPPDSVQKAEGLTFLPDGTALVAVDQHARGPNLATLPTLDRWPRT